MILKLIELAIVAWLPGAVVFRMPIADRPKRASLDAEERSFWIVVISLSISMTFVLALAALNRYTFERLLVADLAVAAVAAALGRFTLRLGGEARRPGFSAALPVALVALGLWSFFPPAEYVIGGKDPGVYMNEGIQIAQRGTFVYNDPVIASVPPFARDLFFPSHLRSDYYALRFMGFFIRDPDTGASVGQFPHLFPASIAIAYGIDGLTGARRAAGVWAILGLLAVYFTGARLVGRTAAFAGAALLAVHVVQVWFARYPNTEVVMQALLFAALLATARAHVDNDAFFAPVAGCLFGLLLFLRIDAALGIVAALTGVGLHVVTGGRLRVMFLFPIVLFGALAALYLSGPMRAYAERPIVFLSNFQWWQYVLIGTLTASALVILVLARRSRRVGDAIRQRVPLVISLGLIAAAVYALYFRHPAGRLAEHDAYALRTFTGFYLTVPALIAALLGYAIAAKQAFWRAPALFMTFAAFSFFFFYKIQIVPEHFWMTRRFLPVILPGALLFAATAALGARGGPWLARPIRRAIGGAFVLLLAIQYIRATVPILDHVEYAGVIPKLEELASAIEDDDLVIVESGDARTDIHTFALPLAYIYARNVLVFSSALPDKVAFAGFLEWARTHYRRVLFIGSGGTDLMSRQWGVNVLGTDRFRVPEYDTPLNAYPRFARQKQFDYTLYEFVAPETVEPEAEFSLDVGLRDDLNVLRFHAKEKTEGRTFRWSRDISYVIVTGLQPADRQLTIWMSNGGRPASAPPADVTVELGDERLGMARVVPGFNVYSFTIPPSLASRAAAAGEPVRIRLRTTTWSPELQLGTPDDRQLGVMVDRVAVK